MSEETIPFDCPECGAELEVPSDAAGDNVECPDCFAFLVVTPPVATRPAVTPSAITPSVVTPSVVPRPEAGGRVELSATASIARESLPSERLAEDTAERKTEQALVAQSHPPSVCMICGATADVTRSACFACGTPTDIDLLRMRRRPRGIFVGEILVTSLRLFVARLGALVPAILVESLLAVLLYVVLIRLVAAGVRMNADWLTVLGVTVVYCVYHALHVGHFRLMLSVARGEPVAGHRLIWPTSGRAYVGPALKMISVSTTFWAAIAFGLLFAIVPALIFSLLAWPCGRIVVDRDLPAGAAISQSIDLTVPHWPGVLSIVAFLGVVQFAIGLIAVGIGQVLVPLLVLCVIVPFSSLVLTVTYLRLSDEPTAVDRAGLPASEND